MAYVRDYDVLFKGFRTCQFCERCETEVYSARPVPFLFIILDEGILIAQTVRPIRLRLPKRHLVWDRISPFRAYTPQEIQFTRQSRQKCTTGDRLHKVFSSKNLRDLIMELCLTKEKEFSFVPKIDLHYKS